MINIENIFIQNVSGDVILKDGKSLSISTGHTYFSGNNLVIENVYDDLQVKIPQEIFSDLRLNNIEGDISIYLTKSKFDKVIINNVNGDISGSIHANSKTINNATGYCNLNLKKSIQAHANQKAAAVVKNTVSKTSAGLDKTNEDSWW